MGEKGQVTQGQGQRQVGQAGNQQDGVASTGGTNQEHSQNALSGQSQSAGGVATMGGASTMANPDPHAGGVATMGGAATMGSGTSTMADPNDPKTMVSGQGTGTSALPLNPSASGEKGQQQSIAGQGGSSTSGGQQEIANEKGASNKDMQAKK